MINEHKLILNPSFLSQRILPLVSVGTSAIGIIAAGTSAGAILVGSYKLKDEVVCSTFGGGVAVVHQPQGVGYLEADIDAFDVFHGAVFGQFGGTAFKGGVEDAEAVQTDTVAVRQRLAHLSYDGFAYVLHVFGRHGSQCFNVLRDTGKVEDFGILGLAFQGVDHGGAAVPDFLVALCAHY